MPWSPPPKLSRRRLSPRLVCHQLLDEEQAVAVDLERKATATKKLVPGSVPSSTIEPATNSLSYEDIVVTNLHIQVATVPNVCSLMNIILDATFNSYARWHHNILLALMRYALTGHDESDDVFPNNPG
jgi:hypothetical protein